jgi:glycolate dehydrogenase iron-sulfur subunit
MQTRLAESIKDSLEADELSSILRACVHCGFCNATCPTYQLLGDERDGPRGRIYLMKQMLEGQQTGLLTQHHLDRCLNCRACETTCPSGVRYGRLVDISKQILEQQCRRPLLDRSQRWLMQAVFPYRWRFALLMRLGRFFKPLLPASLKAKIPNIQKASSWPQSKHKRSMVLMEGCVQPALAPAIDQAAARVLDRLGISLLKVSGSTCCGALNYHLSQHERTLALARQNIDACWPLLEQGAEAVVMTASGCGVTVKEYGELLQYDPVYRDRAKQFSALVKDISEVVENEGAALFFKKNRGKLAFQSPCTLQHGQKLAGKVESILQQAGFKLTEVVDHHLCCGSAGVYSLLQHDLAQQLRQDKLAKLMVGEPQQIATANIGCLNHLQAASTCKVVHWIELLD